MGTLRNSAICIWLAALTSFATAQSIETSSTTRDEAEVAGGVLSAGIGLAPVIAERAKPDIVGVIVPEGAVETAVAPPPVTTAAISKPTSGVANQPAAAKPKARSRTGLRKSNAKDDSPAAQTTTGNIMARALEQDGIYQKKSRTVSIEPGAYFDF